MIQITCDVKTLPTVGPLFGSYKVQLDVFECPMRLYQGKLHMNMLNIGMDMSEVLLPQIEQIAYYDATKGENQQINPSSIYSYLNQRGLGRYTLGNYGVRYFNAIPYLGYWDVYKNYYANKQEERGFVIHSANMDNEFDVVSAIVQVVGTDGSVTSQNVFGGAVAVNTNPGGNAGVVTLTINFKWNTATDQAFGTPDLSGYEIEIDGTTVTLDQVFDVVSVPSQEDIDGVVNGAWAIVCSVYTGAIGTFDWDASAETEIANTVPVEAGPPQMTEFALDNIDGMRMDILEAVRDVTAFKIDRTAAAPYGLGLGFPGNFDTLNAGDAKFYKLNSPIGS